MSDVRDGVCDVVRIQDTSTPRARHADFVEHTGYGK